MVLSCLLTYDTGNKVIERTIISTPLIFQVSAFSLCVLIFPPPAIILYFQTIIEKLRKIKEIESREAVFLHPESLHRN